jgi:2-polyprenyl-6-hydroxyphenyl methylase / 3-demethylubiquinone-9 3-methyltransferase
MVDMVPPARPRNDVRQYDDLVAEWWRPDGEFAALHWLAEARGRLIPPAPHAGARLLDVGCGGGLLAPHVPPGYRHTGVDLSETALAVAAEHGVEPVHADAAALPFGDATFDVVVAGEILEHVPDLAAVVTESCRVLKPGGAWIADTLNDTALSRLAFVTIGERIRGGPPKACHDPDLFVKPERLRALAAAGGVALEFRGLRPAPLQYLGFLARRRRRVEMRPVRSLAGNYQAWGRKAAAA